MTLSLVGGVTPPETPLVMATDVPPSPLQPEPSQTAASLDALHITGVGTAKTATVLFTAGPDVPGQPPATAADARKRADLILVPSASGKGFYGHIEREAIKPNSYSVNWKVNLGPIQNLIAENAALVQPALKALDATQRKQYQLLWDQTADDVGARLSLQLLLIEGTLTAPAPDHVTLLDRLHHLAIPQVPLMSGLVRADFIGDMMQELAFPSSINQGTKGTCTMTAVQMLMAIKRPAELAHIIGQLAGATDDTAALPNGDTLQREPGTETDDESLRTDSSRLFQAAAMEYMNVDGDYDNALDNHLRPDGTRMESRGDQQIVRAITGLLGPGYYVELRRPIQFDSPQAMVALLAEAVANGHPTPVAIYRPSSNVNGDNSSHEVLLLGVNNNRFDYLNPWGKVESMSFDELATSLKEATFVNTDGPQPPVAAMPVLPGGSSGQQSKVPLST